MIRGLGKLVSRHSKHTMYGNGLIGPNVQQEDTIFAQIYNTGTRYMGMYALQAYNVQKWVNWAK